MKSILADNASAIGIIVFSNKPGIAQGTYLSPVPSKGRYAPGAMISQADGLALVEKLKVENITASLTVDSTAENRTT